MVSLLVNTLVTSLKYVSRAASVLLVSNVLELLMYEATRVLVKKRLVPSMRLVVEIASVLVAISAHDEPFQYKRSPGFFVIDATSPRSSIELPLRLAAKPSELVLTQFTLVPVVCKIIPLLPRVAFES